MKYTVHIETWNHEVCVKTFLKKFLWIKSKRIENNFMITTPKCFSAYVICKQIEDVSKLKFFLTFMLKLFCFLIIVLVVVGIITPMTYY